MMGPFGRAISKYGVALSLVTMLIAFPGCGGDKKKSDTASSSSTESTKSKPASGSSTKSAADKEEDGDGRRNVGGVPFDVYFDNPLAEASDQRPVGGSGGATGPVGTEVAMNSEGNTTTPPATATTSEPETVVASSGASADGPKWSELISAQELIDEVQSIRNDLNSRMANFGAYKRAMLEVPVFGSTLAFLADVARRHDGDIKWKDKAHYVRALAITMSEIASSSTGGVKKSYDEVNAAFLTITEILNNNEPAELPEVEVEADFVDFVEMGYLMKRLERGENWLKNNTGSEDSLSEKGPLAQREVSVFAAISESFKSEGFGYAEYEDFVKWADGMRDAAKSMHKAVPAKDFNTFDQARSKISQSCTACHSVYRNG
ncbi:MAG: hypothetical protein O2945_06505 [Planctomycetota bacterium]|nr:hypothetical protein [Planctomycetota bacterium]